MQNTNLSFGLQEKSISKLFRLCNHNFSMLNVSNGDVNIFELSKLGTVLFEDFVFEVLLEIIVSQCL